MLPLTPLPPTPTPQVTYKLPLTPAGLANFLPVCRAVKAQAPPIIDDSVHSTYSNSSSTTNPMQVRGAG